MTSPVSPFTRWLLRLAAPSADRASLLADLDEEARARARNAGAADAHRWARRQVFKSLRPLLARRVELKARESWRLLMSIWRGLGSDFVLALRRLRQAPGFSAICIATLALGIGGNTAVFTLIDGVLLKPLPVARPAELYRLGDTDDCCVNSGLPGSFSLFSYDLFLHLRAAAPEFSQLAAFQANVRGITVGRPDPDVPPEALNGSFVSGNYFQTFELSPAAGRLLQPADDRTGAPPVAVISYHAWTDRFQNRPQVVGEPLTLNGVAATIVGVAPRGFYGDTLRPDPADIWIPLADEPVLQPAANLIEAKGSHWLYAIGRLRSGTPTAPIDAKLTAAVQQWAAETLQLSAEERRSLPQQHVTLTPGGAGVSSMREAVAPSLRLLQAIAAAVLLVACANLANLLLARGLARRTETAVRVALGAPRRRLVAQLLVESFVLSIAGGLAGLALAFAGARAIVDLAFHGANDIPVSAAPSPLVLLFAFGVSLVTGVAFGVAPAIFGSRSDPVDAMRGASRTTADRGSRLRRSLIAVQIALSLVLITCAGLLGRSLANLQAQDFGFAVGGRYVANLAPSLSTIPPDQLPAIYREMRERVGRIPGVANAAFSLYSPMSGDNWANYVTVDGHAVSERLTASWDRVSPGYFDTVGTPIIRGRAFDERDVAGAPLVAVVSQKLAQRFFGDADPIGRRIGFANSSGAGTRDYEIVGIVGDAKYQDAKVEPYVMFFLPFLQEVPDRLTRDGRLDRSHYPQAMEIQTAGLVPSLAATLRRELAGIDRRIVLRRVLTMDEQVAGHFNIDRLIARLAATFGLVALLLACLGLYGVTAHAVTRRTREIGIRMAVGASRVQVLATILRAALAQLAIGAAIGIPAAFAAGRWLQSSLYGVSGHDPAVLAGGVGLLALSAVAAAIIPARRAATMDPVRALRVE